MTTIEQTRHDVSILRRENPDMTLQQIATIVNRSRERVRQICVSENLETRSAKRVETATRPNPTCRICNTEMPKSPRRVYCDECVAHKLQHIDRGLRERRIPRGNIPCHYCKANINMRETLITRHKNHYKNFFCSTSCRSKNVWAMKVLVNIDGRIRRADVEEGTDD